MRDILDDLAPWLRSRRPFVLATVVRTWNSSPRPAGAAMAVSAAGQVIGSVSGGCIEGALYQLAQEVLADGRARSETYRVADDDAIGVGLTCGGTIEVFVRLIDAAACNELSRLAVSISAGSPIALLTELTTGILTPHVVLGADAAGTDGVLDDNAALVCSVRGKLRTGESGLTVFVDPTTDVDVLVEVFGPPPQLYIFGAIDFAAAMCRLGKFAGFTVTVVDARPVFATRARFPDADEVVVSWPHKFLEAAHVDERTVITVLTHDEKFDIPLLAHALRTDAVYVGALGSRATHERRVALLRERGVSESQLDRLHSPIGLDLGARNPAETAVSILAEVLKVSHGTTGHELRDLSGPIHRDSAESIAERPAVGSAARC